MAKVKSLSDGICLIDGKLSTVNMVRGNKVYGEALVEDGNVEYRQWNPYRSKLAAAILNGLKTIEIKPKNHVLYLGAATGTTPSHVSDIVGESGEVYCVEISERNMRELLKLCERRSNMVPILADAQKCAYISDVGINDVIYQDISSKNQAQILLNNTSALKSGGYAYFIIKSQSIDVSKDPKEVFEEELSMIKEKYEIVEKIDIEPYDSAHLFVVLKKK